MIPGVKMVRGTGHRSQPIDPGLPWTIEFNFDPPDFMRVAFVMIYGGSEEYVFQAPTREHVDQLIEQERSNIGNHPRLRRVTITGPEGFREEHTKYPPQRRKE